ncbi:MAG: DUF6702 family protein [Bacteroidales bacterium]
MLRPLAICLWLAVHPVHVTLLSIEYSSGKEAFTAFLRVYYDDFMLDYELLTGKTPEFEINLEQSEAINGIAAYLKERIQLTSGDKPLDFRITDINLSDNELNIYLLFRNAGKSAIFKVKNAILADIYKDQSNLLIFRYMNFEEGVKLTPDNREHVFDVKTNLE